MQFLPAPKYLNKAGMHVGHGEPGPNGRVPLIYALAAVQQWRADPATPKLNFAGVVCAAPRLPLDRGIGYIPSDMEPLPDGRTERIAPIRSLHTAGAASDAWRESNETHSEPRNPAFRAQAAP